jgi:hypothetical protein
VSDLTTPISHNEAVARSLPTRALLDALIVRGVLGKEEAGGYSDGTPRQWVESVRYVTDWETASS